LPKILAIIPARSGSKGVPDKNIQPLGGFPLIQWSIEACKKSTMINQVIVSTDSLEYKSLCEGMGADVPFLRPAEISQDSSTDIEFVIHALDWLKDNNSEPDFIVHMRPTTPLRFPKIVDDAIQKFIDAPSFTALRSIHEMSESAYKNFEVSEDGSLVTAFSHKRDLDHSNLGRQLFPKTFVPNGYVDVLRASFIRDYNLLHGNRVMPYFTEPVSEIDSEADFDFLRYQIGVDSSIKEIIFNPE
jgi:N-acylneuraminate cytidylyltransferase